MSYGSWTDNSKLPGKEACRWGLPLRGGGLLLREAGAQSRIPRLTARRTFIRVFWQQEVCWEKTVASSHGQRLGHHASWAE